MVGLDTNVLIRYIMQDDPVQSPQVNAFFQSLTPADPGFIPIVALVEVCWVLMGPYKQTKSDVVTVFNTILRTQELLVENAALVIQALHTYANGNADFPDCLIERAAHEGGCTHIVTFDRKAATAAGMRLLYS